VIALCNDHFSFALSPLMFLELSACSSTLLRHVGPVIACLITGMIDQHVIFMGRMPVYICSSRLNGIFVSSYRPRGTSLSSWFKSWRSRDVGRQPNCESGQASDSGPRLRLLCAL
jgi:hypothetical protein